MPHSSGGGSSGGGFHSGGSSSSGPSYRTSSRYFPGSTCYVYYGRQGRLRTVYTNGPVKQTKKSVITSFVLLGVMMAAGGAVAFFGGYHNPSKLSTDYSTTITIQDDTNVLSESEETTLKNTFNEFFTVSGICPSILTVDNSVWSSHYASLEGYAYDAYLARFNDESHWLIVYSDIGGTFVNWAFEGMQGNDTDKVLTTRVTDQFDKSLYESLSAKTPVGESINSAFRLIMPNLMDTYFQLEFGLIIFLVIWESLLTIAVVSTILQTIRNKGLQNAVKIDGKAEIKKCPFCGNEYVPGTVVRCPKCGGMLNLDAFEPKE